MENLLSRYLKDRSKLILTKPRPSSLKDTTSPLKMLSEALSRPQQTSLLSRNSPLRMQTDEFIRNR